MLVRSRLSIPDARRRLEAAQARHLDIHEHGVEPLRGRQPYRLYSVRSHDPGMTRPRQHGEHEPLVYLVVLSDKDAERPLLVRDHGRPGRAIPTRARNGCRTLHRDDGHHEMEGAAFLRLTLSP